MMNTTTMMIAGYPLIINYDHSVERDPYGTGDSPKQHYIDVVGVFLEDSKYDVRELFDSWMDEIEEIILAEVA